MSEGSRRERGLEMLRRVYGDALPVPAEGESAFADLMLEQLFAEVWTRPGLDVRDRRLLTMGAIAALGEGPTWKLQVRAALRNGEFTPGQVREVLIHLVHYVGYPRAAGLLGPTEQAIAEADGD